MPEAQNTGSENAKPAPKPSVFSLNNITISMKLSLLVGIMIFFGMLIGGVSVAGISKIVNNDIPILEESRAAYDGLINMRRQEKDFLLRELDSDDFTRAA